MATPAAHAVEARRLPGRVTGSGYPRRADGPGRWPPAYPGVVVARARLPNSGGPGGSRCGPPVLARERIQPDDLRRRRDIEWCPVPELTPTDEPLSMVEVQARADRELDRVAPVLDPLGELFADAGHELALVGGPVRDALLGRPQQRPGLHHLGPPGRDRAAARAAGPTPSGTSAATFGTIGCRKGDVDDRDHDVPLGRLRPRLPQAGGASRRHPRGRPGPPRLHRQRDGGPRCPDASSSTRTAASSTWRTGCSGPRAARRTRSPTTRCG